ncbi:MAG: isoamylase early set domain-containing protein [Candidatus Saganbacteria bacterium]|nr:isoamylase early set domain-containing protein [Candidatus Saganbacteria bacterium]
MAKKKKVTFSFRSAQEMHDVKLAGNFTDWEKGAIMMTKGLSGEWKAQASLEPGEYEYKFLADGAWINDPKADRLTANGWGSENSIKVVK